MTERGTGTEPEWDAERVRGLRRHLGESQAAFAERIGTRQQTVSEWETGTSAPRRMSRRLLHLVAEEHGFYEVAAIGGPPAEDVGR
jgi:DNA-binding transcriptional regulator YiaG